MPLAALEAHRLDETWPWAEDNRDLIVAHWDRLTAANPALFNGRVLIRRRQTLAEGRLSLGYVETDYASFIAFRDFGFPDPSSGNSFAHAALRSSDGAFILGRMARPHGKPRQGLFPGRHARSRRRPRRRHRRSGRLGAARARGGDRPPRRRGRGDRPLGRDLRRRPHGADARGQGAAPGRRDPRPRPRASSPRETRPELSDICLVRTLADIDAEAMPPFMQAYLRFALGSGCS